MNSENAPFSEKTAPPDLNVRDTVRVTADPDSDSVLEKGVMEERADATLDLQPGEVINDKFRIEKKVGAGGMGSVYRATDILIDRPVAIKILTKQLIPDDRAWQRFQQEAKTAGILHHSGIVAIHEYATTPDGAPFLVMDFVEGESLAQKIHREGKIDYMESLRIVSKTCEILDYAHTKGVIHRDVKPANIIVTTDESGQTTAVQLVDFGIAKNTAETQSLTQTGEIFGSPLYMSPEQCNGGKADARSDIYSLGCVLFEMLTGEPPYQSDTALATAVQHLQSPIPIVPKSIDSKADQVQRVINRSLAKDPIARYTTMSSFKESLDSLTAGRVVEKIDALSKPKASFNDYAGAIGSIIFGILLLSLAQRITTQPLGRAGIEIFAVSDILLGVFSIPPIKDAVTEGFQNIDRLVKAGKLPQQTKLVIFVCLFLAYALMCVLITR